MIEFIRNIALYPLFLGKPVVVYFGILTFSAFAFTAFIGYTNYKGKKRIPFKWHPRMVITSFVIATLHASLAISIFL